jgi:ABC-type cobalamin/Fe3+-siderophores transport system ATPase subunit
VLRRELDSITAGEGNSHTCTVPCIISSVIRRLYVNNFRCLENFELPISGRSSVLLIGKNGSGKTTISVALQILQRIARDTNRVGDLVKAKELRRTDVPMRFEIEVELEGTIYEYTIALEFPDGFKELRVFEEKFTVDGEPVYRRELAQVHLLRTGQIADFLIDWHLIALPIVHLKPADDPLFIFKQWLARLLILRPIPALIIGDSEEDTLQPNSQVTNFGAWFQGLLTEAPSAYFKIDGYLKQMMPDLKDIKNQKVGKEARSLVVRFSNTQKDTTLAFADLSDGEKCFMICALVLAASDAFRPLVCFWDEPDNYLALNEVGHFVMALRQAFQSGGGQFIATSHNLEAISRFSDENTVVLFRKSHLEPTIARPLSELQVKGDLVGALIRGDVEPQEAHGEAAPQEQ